MTPRRARLTNLVLLQLAVVAPLLLASRSPVAAGLIGWVACAVQLAVGEDRSRDLRAMLIAGALGTAVEWGAAQAGLMHFAGTTSLGGTPAWLFPSWAMLGASMGYLLAFVRGRFGLALIVGTLGSAGSLQAARAVGEINVASTGAFALTAGLLGLAIAALATFAGRAATHDPAG